MEDHMVNQDHDQPAHPWQEVRALLHRTQGLAGQGALGAQVTRVTRFGNGNGQSIKWTCIRPVPQVGTTHASPSHPEPGGTWVISEICKNRSPEWRPGG